MSDDILGVTIGQDGQCNCCKDALKRSRNEWWPDVAGQNRMVALANKLKREGSGRRYDAAVGLSGGVDSAYLAHYLVREHGLRLLAVHVDGGWNSEPAVHNIEILVRALDLDLVTHVIEWDEMRDVQRSFLYAGVLNQDFPQDHAFFSTLLRVCREYKVKSFLSGVNFSSENLYIEYGGPSSTDGKHVRAIHDQFGARQLKQYPIMSMFEYLFSTKILGYPKRYRPLDYLNYNKEEAQRELKSLYGWRDYGSKHSESSFTKFYQDVYLLQKLQYDKRRLHFSSLIVSQQITREEALTRLEKPPISAIEAERETQFVAKKLGLEFSDLQGLIEKPLVSHDKYSSDHEITKRLISLKNKINYVFGFSR
jgi:hypothetical protein